MALELPERPQFIAEERVRCRLTSLGGRTRIVPVSNAIDDGSDGFLHSLPVADTN